MFQTLVDADADTWSGNFGKTAAAQGPFLQGRTPFEVHLARSAEEFPVFREICLKTGATHTALVMHSLN